MEEDKVSDAYKKAYNQADMICTYMPHLLKGIQIPENEPNEFSRGFQDRIKQHEIKMNAIKNFSFERLKGEYSKDLGDLQKDKEHDKDRE